MIKRLLIAFALLLASTNAFACQPYLVAIYNEPAQGVAFASALCGYGIKTGAVNFQLYYLNGQLNGAFECSGAVSSCYIAYETDLQGSNWGYQALSIGYPYNGPVGEGWIYYVLANELYDGTTFGVRAGGCGGAYCDPAVLFEN